MAPFQPLAHIGDVDDELGVVAARRQDFADKRRNYPPDIERQPGKSYEYKV